MPKITDSAAHDAASVVHLVRVFDAPRSLVFNAWTDPQHLARWWGPHGWGTGRCEFDARPGGALHIEMRGPDGEGHPMAGTVKEVLRPERLVFTGGPLREDGSLLFEVLNTVTFEESGGKTTVTLTAKLVRAEPGFEAYWKGAVAGWTQSLEKLEDSLGPLRTITIIRGFQAPRELVWSAMTDPKQVVKWWGPRGFTTTVEQMDLRPGGTWKLTMVGPDGAKYPNQHTFREVVRPERIVYNLSGSREGGAAPVTAVATWTFTAMDESFTVVEIRMVFPTAEAREFVARQYKAVEGGHQTLERLAEHLQALGAPASAAS